MTSLPDLGSVNEKESNEMAAVAGYADGGDNISDERCANYGDVKPLPGSRRAQSYRPRMWELRFAGSGPRDCALLLSPG